MAQDIVMPRLSDSMEEGTILRWLKSAGDQVSLGEELVEIETDKANMVYEAPAGGTLIETLAQEGDTLPIGQVIARVGEAGEKPSGDGAAAKREPEAAAEAAPAEAAVEAAPGRGPCRRRRRVGTGGSRPLPWRGGSRARRGSISRRSRARGRAVGSSRPTSSGRSPPAPRRRRLRLGAERPRRRPPSPPRERASGRKRPREPWPTRT